MVTPDRKFWSGRSVLVTGATGFKGSWLCLWLNSLGAKVAGIGLAPDTNPSLFELAGVADETRASILDIRDAGALAALVKKGSFEIIFHLAAQPLVRQSYLDPVGTFATNVMGTVHLLEAVRESPTVQAVVVVTSDKCYENREWVWPYREDEPLGGHDPYSSSKGCTELVVNSWRRSFFESARPTLGLGSARAGNVIGGGDWATDRLLPDCVRAFQNGKPVELRYPHAVRPWQHVIEPLCGYLMLAEKLVYDRQKFGRAWNFGPSDADSLTVSKVVDMAANAWGNGASWTHPGESADRHEAETLRVDPSLAMKLLGWKARLSSKERIDWTINWYKSVKSGANAKRLCLEHIATYVEKVD